MIGRTVRAALAPARQRLRRASTPARPVLAVLAAALLAVSAIVPWASFDFGYPGAVDLAGAGGHRLYLLVLALGFGLLALWPERDGWGLQGRRARWSP